MIPDQKEWVSWSKYGAVHCGIPHSKGTCCVYWQPLQSSHDLLWLSCLEHITYYVLKLQYKNRKQHSQHQFKKVHSMRGDSGFNTLRFVHPESHHMGSRTVTVEIIRIRNTLKIPSGILLVSQLFHLSKKKKP